jgi:hypothetical protein
VRARVRVRVRVRMRVSKRDEARREQHMSFENIPPHTGCLALLAHVRQSEAIAQWPSFLLAPLHGDRSECPFAGAPTPSSTPMLPCVGPHNAGLSVEEGARLSKVCKLTSPSLLLTYHTFTKAGVAYSAGVAHLGLIIGGRNLGWCVHSLHCVKQAFGSQK